MKTLFYDSHNNKCWNRTNVSNLADLCLTTRRIYINYDIVRVITSRWRDLNPRPHAPKACMLPTAPHLEIYKGMIQTDTTLSITLSVRTSFHRSPYITILSLKHHSHQYSVRIHVPLIH